MQVAMLLKNRFAPEHEVGKKLAMLLKNRFALEHEVGKNSPELLLLTMYFSVLV